MEQPNFSILFEEFPKNQNLLSELGFLSAFFVSVFVSVFCQADLSAVELGATEGLNPVLIQITSVDRI